MSDKTNWRVVFLEDGLVFIALMSLGLAIAALKLMPVVLRWSKGGR